MKQFENVVKFRSRLGVLLAAVLIITSVMTLPVQYVSAESEPAAISTTASVANIQKYGNVVLDLKCDEIYSAGYEISDVLSVSFLDKDMKLPLCGNFSDVDTGAAGIFARQEDQYVVIAINMKDFATTNGIATKITAADNSVSWEAAEGVPEQFEVTISMDEKGGYYGQYLLHQMSYTTDRADYPNLTDAQFANFREVTTSGMGKGRLYRSASPVNPRYNRNTYADAAAQEAGVTTIMNLADDPETFAMFENVDATYASKQKVIALNMGVDVEAEDFEQKLAQGIRFLLENPGVYLVHCTEGKDRAGYVSALLECLMGASYDEVAADYMTSFYNYYGITAGDERYSLILTNNLDKNLKNAFGLSDLRSADLSAETADFLRGIGLSDEEIAQLKQDLSGNGSQGSNGSSSGKTSEITVNVNGSNVTWTDAVPFIDSNWRTMVPLRAVGDALGLTVSWDNSAREAVFTDGSRTIYFPIGSSTARTGEGSNITMDTAAVIVSDRTYAPVRYLAEYFGYNVGWDNSSKTVTIGGKSESSEPANGNADGTDIAA